VAKTIFAIGHSTRPIEKFTAILRGHHVDVLVDIRTVPKSRHNPQFDADALAVSLDEAGIGYMHLKELGGLRRPLKDSQINNGWTNDSFRGFADHMQTEAFGAALQKLAGLADDHHVAFMCAEGNPFRCHRSLVADALTARGISVTHISSIREGRPHRMTSFAQVVRERITYPAK
jgi:uncharacterized protein (DUF488 family)